MQRCTPVPNIVFDSLITHFSESELKVFLIITRKTMGWYDKKTGDRKKRDWIALSQFKGFTGLSGVSILKALSSLSERGYILITDINNNVLLGAEQRKGMKMMFYELHPTLINFF